MLLRFVSDPRFLAAYSGIRSLSLFLSRMTAPACSAYPARSNTTRNTDFDQLSVHRLNIVEPDGTPRLVISDKSVSARSSKDKRSLGPTASKQACSS